MSDDVRVVYERSSSHPIEYAITLRVLHDASWHTIYLFDNAHGFQEHHEHHYLGDVKQSPTLIEGDTNTVMANALSMLFASWREIFEIWEGTR